MRDVELPDMRFNRTLNFRIRGVESKGELTIGEVFYREEKKRWECKFSIAHIHPEERSFPGDDPLAALSLTMDFVSSLIRGSEADGLIVWWQNEGDHGGLVFPMCEKEAVTGRKPIWEIPK